jgi:hypothetical protein
MEICLCRSSSSNMMLMQMMKQTKARVLLLL